MLEKYSGYDLSLLTRPGWGNLDAIWNDLFLDLEDLESKFAICLICALGIMDFGVILKQEMCTGRLVVTFVAALQHRNTKALVFLNTEMLLRMMRWWDSQADLVSLGWADPDKSLKCFSFRMFSRAFGHADSEYAIYCYVRPPEDRAH